jgi:hypothetical protein
MLDGLVSFHPKKYPPTRGKMKLDVLLGGLGVQVLDDLGALLVVEGVSDGHVVTNLQESKCHSSADNQLVDLSQRWTTFLFVTDAPVPGKCTTLHHWRAFDV